MAYMDFNALKQDIATKGDVRDPGAVAATIGRRKYGGKAMGHASALGRRKGHGAAAAFLKGLKG